MRDHNFYPGPSKVYSSISEYIYEAYMKGIMSVNHRSDLFMQLVGKTKSILREKLEIPDDYEIAFISSATESWEIISQSLVKEESQHFFNGAFGAKWYDFATALHTTSKVDFDINEELPVDKVNTKADVICVTQNETSNATQVKMPILKLLRKASPNALIALDVTSSIGGIALDFSLGDIWYASVQKCLGLPAGLGVMILSPAAQKRADEVDDKKYYNSLTHILANTRKNQTHYTPNVLNIYLLYKTQKRMKAVENVHKKTLKRAKFYYSALSDCSGLDFLVKNEKVRSDTVIALTHSEPLSVITQAADRRIVLGKGYGKWKDESFRIANFPAIKTEEIEKLMQFFEKDLK